MMDDINEQTNEENTSSMSIPSTTPMKIESTYTQPRRSLASSNNSVGFVLSTELLKVYYDRLYPTSAMYRWLSYGDQDTGNRREFSFTLQDDIYVRYLAFSGKEQFKEELLKRVPVKIDIGAVYNSSPALHASVSKFAPTAREFIIDIDMSDYNDIRRCCEESNICNRCWPLMNAAVRVLDSTLRQEFGFRHILWVYSGRRGVHCWINDRKARLLTNDIRGAVIDYLSLYIGGNEQNKQSRIAPLSYPLHPNIQRIIEQLQPFFDKLIREQLWFSCKRDGRALINALDPSARNDFNWRYKGEIGNIDNMTGITDGIAPPPSTSTSEQYSEEENPLSDEGPEVWRVYNDTIQSSMLKLSSGRNALQSRDIVRSLALTPYRIMLSHCYPRLDVNVSKQMNHLLKAPFCIHPKTGRVCVPIDPKHVESFNPSMVPTLDQLLEELNQSDGSAKAWTRTSLAPHLEYFTGFIRSIINDEKEHLRQSLTKTDDDETKDDSMIYSF